MKLLLLTDSDAFAGTERHMLDLARGLVELGVSVFIGCPQGTPLAKRVASSHATHVDVPRAIKPGVVRLRALFREHMFDVCHTHNGRTSFMAAMAGAGNPKAKAPRLVSTLHFINLAREDRRGWRGWLSHQVHTWLNKRTACFVAISDAVQDAALKRNPELRTRIKRVHNGSWSAPAVTCPAQEIRANLGLSEDAHLILTVTRLQPEKSVELVIQAARLLDSLTNWTWLIAGEGVLQESLEKQVQVFWPQNPPVHFLGVRDDVPELMSAADVLVHPAPGEPFGLVLTEAMSAGLAVIAAHGGAAPEIVVDGETGALYEPGDARALAESIKCLLRDDKYCRFGQRGRERFEDHFTAQRMAKEMESVYRFACSDAAGKGSVEDHVVK